MKVHTKTVFEWDEDANGYIRVEDNFFDYDGPIAKSCGGDALADQKKQEAQSQINLNNELNSLFQNYSAATTPFWMNLMKNGNPYLSQLTDYGKGTIAQSYAPARGALARSMAGYGSTLPAGFRTQAETNLNAAEGNAFDQNMMQLLNQNLMTKEQAAAALNPFEPAQLASGTASSVLGAPPVNAGGFGNFMGGLLSNLMGNQNAKLGGTTGGVSWSI